MALIALAGGTHEIAVGRAVRELLAYPSATLRYYGCGPASPPDEVTPTDIGRGVSGVGPAIASKLLHLKRPAFFPLLDSVLRALYRSVGEKAYQSSDYWRTARPRWRQLLWAAIRADVVDSGNVAALTEVRAELSGSGEEGARQIAGLTDVRLLDMLAWMMETQPQVPPSGPSA